ncbi:hypothetical protein, partial [Brevundimonas sp.]|uniref:hypothetical protein n=1 Tax=Brevundimonas sp. TaxID=1871086 RepID=UPI0028997199
SGGPQVAAAGAAPMTDRNLNAGRATGDGREPAVAPPPPAPRSDDRAWALGFLRLIQARDDRSRRCA